MKENVFLIGWLNKHIKIKNMKTKLTILIILTLILYSCSVGRYSGGNCPTTNKRFYFNQNNLR